MTIGRVQRLSGAKGPALRFHLDGRALTGIAGDTVLTAVLACRPDLRADEFGPGRRAGFCLMGACQDCWLWTEAGRRLRACATPLSEGLRLLSAPPADWPAIRPDGGAEPTAEPGAELGAELGAAR